jgi:RimJ/RimL family protein N-acetyltransferase
MDIAIKPLQTTDASALFALIDRNRAPLGRWMPLPEKIGQFSDVVAFLQDCVEQRHAGLDASYFILLAGRPVGFIGLHDIGAGAASVGYWIDAPYSSRGIVTEALRLLEQRAFHEQTVSMLKLACNANNRASRRVAEKCGFIPAGVLAGAENLQGVVTDVLLYVKDIREDIRAAQEHEARLSTQASALENSDDLGQQRQCLGTRTLEGIAADDAAERPALVQPFDGCYQRLGGGGFAAGENHDTPAGE